MNEKPTITTEVDGSFPLVQPAKIVWNWQSVVTAPKDGTPILGLFFDCRGDGEYRQIVVEWWPHQGGFWIDSCYKGRPFSFLKLTHWFPLPGPPSAEGS